MGEVINLRLARKRRARASAEAEAASNRARHGRTKGQKAADKATKAERDRHLDDHALETDSAAASVTREPDQPS